MSNPSDFAPSAPSAGRLSALRKAIEGATRPPEAECLAGLMAGARFSPEQNLRIAAVAQHLASGVRRDRSRASGVDALMNEFALDSGEGVALMCLAEALLRVPDAEGRTRLIRDKLRGRDWAAHVGHSPSLFVNAAAWSLALTGRLLAPHDAAHLAGGLAAVAARGGEVLVREAMEYAMGYVGQQFVMGETIEQALERAGEGDAANFRYSFDMLGEAALTAADAARYAGDYAHAIHAIGAHDRWRGVHKGNGISIKLSALHPRYHWSQRSRVLAELLPRVTHLCVLARGHDIGLTIDAEESDRLELSLDILAALAANPDLADWGGLGFVVQAYQKRAPSVIDWIIELARLHDRRIMVRLVKGAYWDGEIKRAQQEGLADYPVYTRKAHTDVAYLACARKLLAAPDAVFPLFATHNAHTVAAVLEMAPRFRPGDYEFQCLHGMGQSLYRQILAAEDPALCRPVRVYAPVGSHQTLLAYLVRRLLENGANTSFVNRIVDDRVSLSALVADPWDKASASAGTPHPGIVLPQAILPGRRNSRGFDLASAAVRRAYLAALEKSREGSPLVVPRVAADPMVSAGVFQGVCDPARNSERVGEWRPALAQEVEAALAAAQAAAPGWAGSPIELRAACLERMALALESHCHALVVLLLREAGKTFAAGQAEVREAADFCRYYASRLRAGDADAGHALGPVLAISPWNFPVAIFTGQIAAALAAGNPVIAKPAEQTPLLADRIVALFHDAGVPRPVLQCLPGRGEDVGAALVADGRICGVLFTGSTAVAKQIQRQLARRGDIPLVAETGGVNAMIVDSTALPEQVVSDALYSAFDSAGQRCSALRLLCVQADIFERVVELLDGAMAELVVGPTEDFSTDVGPVIDEAARLHIEAYVDAMRANRHTVLTRLLPEACRDGHFVAPTLIVLERPDELRQEIFGPVLHVLSYRAEDLDAMLDQLAARGHGLTLGIQSRVEERIAHIIARSRVGNIYVNRNMIGAVVGVQPFGGEGLSGTGPKAGGPLTLAALRRGGGAVILPDLVRPPRPALDLLAHWLAGEGRACVGEHGSGVLLEHLERYRASSLAGLTLSLPGPTGETNTLGFHPRGRVLGLAEGAAGWLHQLVVCVATENVLVLPESPAALALLDALGDLLPETLRPRCEGEEGSNAGQYAAVLADLPDGARAAWRRRLADQDGPILPFLLPSPVYAAERLVVERCVTVNTTASGGNASLMRLADA